MDEKSTPQDGTNPELEVGVEDTTTDGTEETPAEDTQEEMVPRSHLNQAVARAKKAEALLKTTQKTEAKPIIQNALSEEEVEIKILKAAGRSEDEITYLKKLARVNEVSLLDAQSDDLFLGFQKKREDEVKAQKAKLGASRGSGSVKKERTINSSGLTDAEHKELWKSQNGR